MYFYDGSQRALIVFIICVSAPEQLKTLGGGSEGEGRTNACVYYNDFPNGFHSLTYFDVFKVGKVHQRPLD